VQKITTFLWFDKQAEEAMNYYIDTFKGSPAKDGNDSEIVHIQYYPEGYTEGPMANMQGKVLTGVFKLAGQKFMCLDGGPIFKFNEAMSLYVDCADQTEIDYFWERLSLDPSGGQCGWTKDTFGLSVHRSINFTAGLFNFFNGLLNVIYRYNHRWRLRIRAISFGIKTAINVAWSFNHAIIVCVGCLGHYVTTHPSSHVLSFPTKRCFVKLDHAIFVVIAHFKMHYWTHFHNFSSDLPFNYIPKLIKVKTVNIKM
jgi:predicted 3-demethylubiquinone-9 3-methyltransferase (glyoxalase superfamily)